MLRQNQLDRLNPASAPVVHSALQILALLRDIDLRLIVLLVTECRQTDVYSLAPWYCIYATLTTAMAEVIGHPPGLSQHRFILPLCGSVTEWLGCWTCDKQVTSSNPGLSAVECNPDLCHQAV